MQRSSRPLIRGELLLEGLFFRGDTALAFAFAQSPLQPHQYGTRRVPDTTISIGEFSVGAHI